MADDADGLAVAVTGIVAKLPTQSRTILYNAGKFVLGLALLATTLAAIVPPSTKVGAVIAGVAATLDGLAGIYLRLTTTTPIGTPSAAGSNNE